VFKHQLESAEHFIFITVCWNNQ